MRITTIPQVYRHINRWREILGVLSKYGLANWASRFDLAFAKDLFNGQDGEKLARLSHERRIRLALNELGPTFIKLGQILSTRPDLVGVELATELQCLQNETRPDPPEVVRQTIETELGLPLDEAFAQFDDVALASASIGQVHSATLHNGRAVVVKVQHAHIEDKIRVDLDILTGLASLAEKVPELEPYRPRQTVTEFQRVLRRELDFVREARNMHQFSQLLAELPYVRIPRAYHEYTTARMLTMDRIDGCKLSAYSPEVYPQLDPELIARRGAEAYLTMIFEHGFYHADPHPGNIVLLPENVIGLLDFGMVGRIDERMREDFEEMLMAVVAQDPVHLTSIVMRLGSVPPTLDTAALNSDVADFVAHYATQSVTEFDLSGALAEMIQMIHRYHISLPPSIALLLKVLIMLEGTSRRLSPKFSLLEIMQPYQKQALWRRMSPRRHWHKLRRISSDYERLFEAFPRGMIDILQQVQSGKFDVHLDHRGLEPSVNRLVLGMLASALFLGSTLLMANHVPPLVSIPWVLPQVSLLGLSGCAVAIALGLRLLRAINKSGHLDRRRHHED